MSRNQFDQWLKEWYENTTERTVGEYGNYGQRPHIFVSNNNRIFHLNADTKRLGVEEYLHLLAIETNIIWNIIPNRNGVFNKVAFGREKKVIPGFYLYLCQ